MATQFDLLQRDTGSAAILYDSDGMGHPLAVRLTLSNRKYVVMLGTARGDVIAVHLAPGTLVAPGQVVAVTAQPPEGLTRWYLVVKRLLATRRFLFDVGSDVALISLPYQLSVLRADPTGASAQPNALDGWDEPSGLTGDGRVNEVEMGSSIRCGFANQSDPLSLQMEGAVPAGVTTLFAPLGSDIRLGDEIHAVSVTDAQGNPVMGGALPLSLTYTVTTLNHAFADETPYALQALLSPSTGSGGPALGTLIWDEGNWDGALWG